jgi:hypothetical protein
LRARAGGLAETYTTASGSNRLAQVDDGTVIRSFTYDGSGAVTGDDREPAQATAGFRAFEPTNSRLRMREIRFFVVMFQEADSGAAGWNLGRARLKH